MNEGREAGWMEYYEWSDCTGKRYCSHRTKKRIILIMYNTHKVPFENAVSFHLNNNNEHFPFLIMVVQYILIMMNEVKRSNAVPHTAFL